MQTMKSNHETGKTQWNRLSEKKTYSKLTKWHHKWNAVLLLMMFYIRVIHHATSPDPIEGFRPWIWWGSTFEKALVSYQRPLLFRNSELSLPLFVIHIYHSIAFKGLFCLSLHPFKNHNSTLFSIEKFFLFLLSLLR